LGSHRFRPYYATPADGRKATLANPPAYAQGITAPNGAADRGMAFITSTPAGNIALRQCSKRRHTLNKGASQSNACILLPLGSPPDTA